MTLHGLANGLRNAADQLDAERDRQRRVLNDLDRETAMLRAALSQYETRAEIRRRYQDAELPLMDDAA